MTLIQLDLGKTSKHLVIVVSRNHDLDILIEKKSNLATLVYD